MEDLHVLWVKWKRDSHMGSIPMHINNWFLADCGTYSNMLRELMVITNIHGSACYYKIAKENDVEWMEWYK